MVCNEATSAGDSVDVATEKLTADAADVKSDDTTDAATMSNPPSLVNLAAQCVSGGTLRRKAWADSPIEPSAMHASSGPCYELDPTPQEAAAAAAAAAAATSQRVTSSDSGGEDSSKENKENTADRSDNGKGAKKKGL